MPKESQNQALEPPPGLPNPEQAQVAVPEPQQLAVPAPKKLAQARPLADGDDKVISELIKSAAPRTGDGGIVAISTGPRLQALQELFGTPHGFVVKLGILARRPAAIPHPEPMLSRQQAEFQLVVTKFKDGDDSTWHVTKWHPFELKLSLIHI